MNTRHLILKGRAMTASNSAPLASAELALLVDRAKVRLNTDAISAPRTRAYLRELTEVMERTIVTIQVTHLGATAACPNPVTIDELRDAAKDALRAQSTHGGSLDILFGNISAGIQSAWVFVEPQKPIVTAATVCDTLSGLRGQCESASTAPEAWASDIKLLTELCDVLDRTINTIKVRNGLALVEPNHHHHPITADDLRDTAKVLARHGGDLYELHDQVQRALLTASTFLAPPRTMTDETRDMLLDQMLNTQCADAWEDILGDCEATTLLRDREEQNAR